MTGIFFEQSSNLRVKCQAFFFEQSSLFWRKGKMSDIFFELNVGHFFELNVGFT